jgi:triosephosphate isomerase (TIM)
MGKWRRKRQENGGIAVRQLVAGNWKMNGLGADLAELEALKGAAATAACDILICPPATLITRAASAAQGAFAIGGQDCRAEAAGAFTGDVSAEMLKDAGASAVIVGHSERRHYHGESDKVVAAKAQAAWRAGLTAIICIGETEAQHDAGHTAKVCHDQIAGSVPRGAIAANTVLAYEPIWAIGSGKTPSRGDIAAIHADIRARLKAQLGDAGGHLRILYGGSVKAANAEEILGIDHVNGALVGGASLKAQEFLAIIAASKPC